MTKKITRHISMKIYSHGHTPSNAAIIENALKIRAM